MKVKCSSCHEGTLNHILAVEHGSAFMGSLVPKFGISNWFNSRCNREGHCTSVQNARKWFGLDFWKSTIQCKCIVLNVDFGALGNGDALWGLMVLSPLEMRKVNCRGHALMGRKNQESRTTTNDSPDYRVSFRMEKDVGIRVTRFICNKNYYYYTRKVMSLPKKFQSSLKLLTTISPYDWQPAL